MSRRCSLNDSVFTGIREVYTETLLRSFVICFVIGQFENFAVKNRLSVVVVVVTLFIHGKFISSVNYKILMIINTILKTKTILIYTNKTLLYMNAVCYKR